MSCLTTDNLHDLLTRKNSTTHNDKGEKNIKCLTPSSFLASAMLYYMMDDYIELINTPTFRILSPNIRHRCMVRLSIEELDKYGRYILRANNNKQLISSPNSIPLPDIPLNFIRSAFDRRISPMIINDLLTLDIIYGSKIGLIYGDILSVRRVLNHKYDYTSFLRRIFERRIILIYFLEFDEINYLTSKFINELMDYYDYSYEERQKARSNCIINKHTTVSPLIPHIRRLNQDKSIQQIMLEFSFMSTINNNDPSLVENEVDNIAKYNTSYFINHIIEHPLTSVYHKYTAIPSEFELFRNRLSTTSIISYFLDEKSKNMNYRAASEFYTWMQHFSNEDVKEIIKINPLCKSLWEENIIL